MDQAQAEMGLNYCSLYRFSNVAVPHFNW